MNVNVEALRRALDEQVTKGRHPWEAAGERRWLAGVEQSQGVLSNETHGEMIQVMDEWLADRMDLPPDDISLARAVARTYESYLDDRVNISSLNPPPWQALETAWREWREGGGTGG